MFLLWKKKVRFVHRYSPAAIKLGFSAKFVLENRVRKISNATFITIISVSMNFNFNRIKGL